MPLVFPPILPRAAGRGAALIIVLAFVVLLTGLLVVFFTRVTNERNVANSSSNTDKADVLARSALDSIVADLKQEIAQGSTPTTVGSGTTASTIYSPLAPANAVPVRSGTVPTIPNLIRRSVRPQAAPSPTPSNASPVNSATDVSANGRSVSLARWNSHYLIPRKTPGGTSSDATPISDFNAPDWVLVNRTGPLTSNPPTTWSTSMGDASSGNQSFVVGRYAYAIYDEGGLLDANVAGYPSQTTTTQSGRKGRASFADLTQLKAADGSWALTQAQIDNLVGWRNHASTQPGGTFPSLTFNSSAATNYFYLVTGTKQVAGSSTETPDPSNMFTLNGFLTVPAATFNGQTDQGFNSRQQLIQISRSLGIVPDALQYLGTFSRDLEQPSFVPNPSRPPVQSNAGVLQGGGVNLSANIATFGTGNDAYPVSMNIINPSLLTVRAAGTFLRNDGSTAVVGEPLVKKRFPLSRLSLILYNSTNSRSQTDPIYKNFGLYRTDASQPWVYDHRTANDGSIAGILKLQDVAAWVDPSTGKVGRDPDFFELLKAAINVGSLAKGAAGTYNLQDWSTANTAFNLQQELDNSVDLHLLQIGANIIDQATTDDLPTRIQFANDTINIICGVQDLPYIYRVRDRPVQATTSTGEYLLIPELWNPHVLTTSATLRPTYFRFRVAALNPAATNTLQITYRGVSTPLTPLNLAATWVGSTPMAFNAGEPTYYGFREPTLLAEAGKPAGTNLSGHTTPETALAGATQPPGRTLVGISPIYTGGSSATSFAWNPDGNTTHLAVKANYANVPVVYCYLDYLDPSGSGIWITYDQQLFQWNQSTSFNIYTSAGTNTGIVWDVNSTANSLIMAASRTDPRTSRWGMPHTTFANDIQPVTAGTSSYAYPSTRWTGGLAYGHHIGGIGDLGFTGASTGYSSSVYPDRDFRGFDPGYWEENTVRVDEGGGTDPYGNAISSDPGNIAHYNRDPDGIVRRVTGGYASDANSGGSGGAFAPTQTVGLPMVLSNNQSRPILLHRPFRSVAELGYVFRGTPWGNLNMSFPESGDAALLDVFCVNELQGTNNLVAGRVDANTQQTPVLQALIAGAITDDAATPSTLTSTQAGNIAALLISRTTGTSPPAGTTIPPNFTSSTPPHGPLANRSELVGRYYFAGNATANLQTDVTPDDYYTGFSYDIGSAVGVNGQSAALSPRLREASIRALADSTTARTWNLLIDVVAQTGRYPVNNPSGKPLANFAVEGERRYWLHVAIDRYTGQVLDAQYEPVTQ